MLVTAWKWATRRPLFGVGVSLALHLLLVAALLGLGGPSSVPSMKRGEPIFVELPQADEQAMRGAPATPAPAPPTPKARPAPPAPQVASPPPRSAPQPSRPETRAPERPSVASAPPPPPIPAAPTPEAEAPRPAPAPTKAEEAAPSEPARTPEVPPSEAPPASPAPRVGAVPEQPQPAPDIRPDIRSALRRGGPGTGGAGGNGKTWAGIEGEPIPLDSTDAKFNDYLDRVRRMIKEKWGYPCIKDLATGHCDYKSARLVIVFGILKDGRVPTLEVAQQSGYRVYDDYAVNAIKLAAPFPPVPPSLMATAKSGSSGVKIMAAFQYVLFESSLTNILR